MNPLRRLSWAFPVWLAISQLNAPPACGAPLLTFLQAEVDGSGGVNGLSQASAVTVSPDGKNLYATGAGDNAVAVFSRSTVSSRLTFVAAQVDGMNGVQGLQGAAAVAVSPDNQHVYVAGKTSSAVAVFSRDSNTGALTFVEAQVNGQNGVSGLGGASSLAVSPDGHDVYATGSTDAAIVVFHRNASSGALTFVAAVVNGQNGVTDLVNPGSVSVSPDGLSVYAVAVGVAVNTGAVIGFSRDLATGLLTFAQALVEGTDGVSGLSRVQRLVVSADGKNVYTASLDDRETIFSRDATGMLTFVRNADNGQGGSTALAISPDGTRLYVTGFVSAAISELYVFTRDVATGLISLNDSATQSSATNDHPSPPVPALKGAAAVTVSPDNVGVYVAGRSANAVTVFSTSVSCVGDCSGDGSVTVDELLTGVNIALGTQPVTDCPPFDPNGDNQVTVDELLTAVTNALSGCPM